MSRRGGEAVPAKADPFVQRRLLDVARIDQAVAAAEHRRRTLPELALIADGTATVDELRGAAVRWPRPRSATWTGEPRKLDNEIDAVRARAKRDSDRLAAGIAPAKDLENMQHEIVSLARRQATLEDEALELMERREVADAALARIERDLTTARAELAAAAAAAATTPSPTSTTSCSGSPPSAPDLTRRHAGRPDRAVRADPRARPGRGGAR